MRATSTPAAATRAGTSRSLRRRGRQRGRRRWRPSAGSAADASAAAIGAVAAHAARDRPLPQPGHRRATTRPAARLGLSPRPGDIRYNTVLNIQKPQLPSSGASWSTPTIRSPARRSRLDQHLDGASPISPPSSWSTSSATSTASSARPTSPTARYIQRLGRRGQARAGRAAPTMTARPRSTGAWRAATTLGAQASGALTTATPPAELQAVLAAGKDRRADVPARGMTSPRPRSAKVQATLAHGAAARRSRPR